MRVTIEKLSGMLVMRIPDGLAAELGLEQGSVADLRIENRRLVLVPSAAEPLDAFGKTMKHPRGTADARPCLEF